MTASAIAQQATLLAKGPIESSVVDSGVTPSRGNAFLGRLKADDPAERGRDANRAAGIGSDRDNGATIYDPPGISRRS
jgi:hypothetical protein